MSWHINPASRLPRYPTICVLISVCPTHLSHFFPFLFSLLSNTKGGGEWRDSYNSGWVFKACWQVRDLSHIRSEVATRHPSPSPRTAGSVTVGLGSSTLDCQAAGDLQSAFHQFSRVNGSIEKFDVSPYILCIRATRRI